MRHVTLTCKNHPNLRWSCKSIAFTPGHGYNGTRSIFFNGQVDGDEFRPPECTCPATDLILAPEDPWASLSLDEQRSKFAED